MEAQSIQHDRSSLQSALRGDARDRRYAHHYVGRPATGGTHVIHPSTLTAASAAALAGAVVHEFTRPAPSGSRWPTRRPAAIHVHVHVVVVKVARHCVNFVIQPCQAAPFTAISTVENLQVDVYSLCRYIPRNLSGIILIQTTNQ